MIAHLLAAIALFTLAANAAAHEFWLQAEPSGERDRVVLQLHVGEYLQGDRVAWVTSHAAGFRVHAAAGVRDWLSAVPADGRNLASIAPASRLVAGTVLPPPAPIFPRYVEPAA